MAVVPTSSPFGSPTRTRILLSLDLLGESYPRELARLIGSPLSVAQKALRSLERDGLVAGRSVGRTRLYTLDPRYLAAAEVRQLVRRLAQADHALQARAAQVRRRPRRAGKPL